MEELFRFSVIRPVTRSSEPTASLERPRTSTPPPSPNIRGVAPPPPATTFQDQLRYMVQSLAGDNIDPETIWKRLEPIALDFIRNQSDAILNNSLWNSLTDFLDTVQKAIANWTTESKFDFASLLKSLGPQGGQTSLPAYRLDLADLFIALLIIRRGGPSNLDSIIRSGKLWDYVERLSDNPTLQEIADRIRFIDLIMAGPTALTPPPDAKTISDKQAAVQLAFETAMNKTLLYPPAILAPLRKPVHGVGFREFHVVKQHIRRYELAEIGRIENILKGESRDHSQKHTLSNERDTFLQTQTTTETDKELTSTDHVDIKNETQNQVKEDTKVDAGVHASYGGSGSSYKLQADLTVSYDKATDDTKKYASDVAKDVTQKAVTKVTQQVTQSQTTKIIETFEETEDQSFDNKSGQAHVSGVYQWVEKVYLSQVFNLGRHLLLDIMVPEPGASLLKMATTPPSDQTLPVQPDPLGTFHVDQDTKLKILDTPLTPDQLNFSDNTDPNYYGKWIARYHVTGVDPEPPQYTTVAKSIAAKRDNDIGQVIANDTIQLPDGYEATAINVTVAWLHLVPTTGGAPSELEIGVGAQNFHFDENINKGKWYNDYTDSQHYDYGANPEQGQLPVTFVASWVEHAAADIEIICKPTSERLAKWQLVVYEKIVTAWQKLQDDYDKMANLRTQSATVGPLGAADTEANRLTERIELKRACIAIMDNANETVSGAPPNIAVQDSQDPKSPDPKSPFLPKLPEPILPFKPNPLGYKTAQEFGVRVRWFEQAFEWENIAYVFYPYFWGRRQNWIEELNLKNDDPIFLKFLQAGYARVVVPVRRGFELAVLFYLHTGLPWLGDALPPVGDKTQNPLYLDVADEIKALTGGGEPGEIEIPIGDPWEYTLPTTLMKLGKDDALPEWHRVGLDGKEDEAKYPSDQPGGAWLWRDGPPT